METWSAHLLYQNCVNQLGADKAVAIQQYTINLQQQRLPVIFSLGHLSKITAIDYDFLHKTINRKRESSNYNLFAIQKRSGRRRFIHAVNGKLFYLQKFINCDILQRITPHHSSYAFHGSGGIKKCATVHCGCKWMLQFDLKDFFYAISEPMIFEALKELGYKSLFAFELTRLCTTLRLPKSKKSYIRYRNIQPKLFDSEEKKIPYLPQAELGVLPQGAPTSPMLSNLVSKRLDNDLFTYAKTNGFVYTRYADDLTFSATRLPHGKSIGQLKREIISLIRKNKFMENPQKFSVAGPGSKKIVLGLLVDGEYPRISKEFLKRIDINCWSIKKYGLQPASKHFKFESAYGFYNHVKGLLAFINDVSPRQFKKINSKFGTFDEYAFIEPLKKHD